MTFDSLLHDVPFIELVKMSFITDAVLAVRLMPSAVLLCVVVYVVLLLIERFKWGRG